jgi:hypothetical protein
MNMSTFTPSILSLPERERLIKAAKALRMAARRIEVALEGSDELPPAWVRGAIIKAAVVLGTAEQYFASRAPEKKEP